MLVNKAVLFCTKKTVTSLKILQCLLKTKQKNIKVQNIAKDSSIQMLAVRKSGSKDDKAGGWERERGKGESERIKGMRRNSDRVGDKGVEE